MKGKQYLVNEGEEILVDRMQEEVGKTLSISEVLFLKEDDMYLVGAPFVPSVHVIVKIVEEVKGEKLKISKFKAKIRYRRTIGFRPLYTKILIEKIIKEKSTREKLHS